MRWYFRLLFISVVAVFLLLVTPIFNVHLYQDELNVFPKLEKAPLSEVIDGYDGNTIAVRYEDKVLQLVDAPMIAEGDIYLPVSLVHDHLNENFFWDEEEGVLTYTTLRDVIRMKTEALTYFINDEPLELNMPILELKEDVPYMPLDLVERFSNASFSYNESLKLLDMENLLEDSDYVEISAEEGGYVRTWKDRTSAYVEELPLGEEIQIYEDDGIWLYVKTPSGLTGYIKKRYTGNKQYEFGSSDKLLIEPYTYEKKYDGKLNMAWHQVFNVAANRNMAEKTSKAIGLNVLSPTWFSLKNEDGDLTNIADITYVRTAHQKGYQVWALVDNAFDRELTHEVLSSTAKRERIIKQLLAYAAIYDLDGINIDFENVAKEDGIYFVQFMKELTPYLKSQGLVVSVDMYVPSAWTAHYDRTTMGELVDYVMIMGYDEHWSTSPESGSVASIGFVEKGIVNTLEEVPAEKVVLGIPFYTRKWKEVIEDGKVVVSQQSMSMNNAYDDLKENDADIVWLDETAQYYGEYEKDNATYKIWLEDETSIEEKVKLMDAYGLAGVSAWKLGLERDEVWPTLSGYLE